MQEESKVELKYCERCGGLWLRRQGNPQVYCVSCAPEMRQFATPRKKLNPSEHWNRQMQSMGGAVCA